MSESGGLELRLLLQLIKNALGADQPTPSLCVDASTNFPRLVALSAQHGLAPLVYRGLGESMEMLPVAVQASLRSQYIESAVRSAVWLAPALKQILTSLRECGIEPVVLKGAALAYLAYPRPDLRTMSDIDLLVAPSELRRASEVLVEQGYGIDTQLALAAHHLPAHCSPDHQVCVELHGELLPPSHPFRLTTQDLRARAEQRTIAGASAYTLALPDTLHHICVHLAYTHRYQWHLLRSLTDILALVTINRTQLDWDAFLASVHLARTSGAVFWPLFLSQHWLGAPIPAEVLARLAPRGPVRTLIEAVLTGENVLTGEQKADQADAVLANALFTLSLYSGCSSGQQARVLWDCLLPPPEAIGHLPKNLAQSRIRYAAYLSNPLRLARGVLAFGKLVASLN